MMNIMICKWIFAEKVKAKISHPALHLLCWGSESSLGYWNSLQINNKQRNKFVFCPLVSAKIYRVAEGGSNGKKKKNKGSCGYFTSRSVAATF